MEEPENTLTLAYMNIRGQTGLNLAKQLQIETFLKSYKIDILHCQEINILEDTFSECSFITSSYNILSNNAQNKYGTCSLVSNVFSTENIKNDTNGRVLAFDIQNITFCNVYMPSGSDPQMKNRRENYAAEVIPQILINCKENGCIGGDWNSIIENKDATKNQAQKQSKCLKRLIKTFNWTDSFRQHYPDSLQFSRYYDNSVHGEGASRLDRNYHFGNIKIIELFYVGVAFSDHISHVIKIELPKNAAKITSPKSRPLFKSKPAVIQDEKFKIQLKESLIMWHQVRHAGLDTLFWWETVVKPGIKKLLIARGKEINKERTGELNLLLIHQDYLVRKLQAGDHDRLADLHLTQRRIMAWHNKEAEKVKLQSRGDEINEPENVRIYHHEIHKNHIKRSQILKLKTGDITLTGHRACADFLENSVAELLLSPAILDEAAQEELLADVQPVFTAADNVMMTKHPDKAEVKESIWTSNLQAQMG